MSTKILINTIQVRDKKLIVFDDMIVLYMISNKTFNLIVTELFIRGIKLHISLIFTTQSYFAVPENITLNSTHCFIIKISNK